MAINAEAARGFIKRLELCDMRRSTLYQVLELLVERQAAYLLSGRREDLQVLTQRSAATKLGINSGLLNRLIAGRYLLRTAGGELALRSLFVSRKSVVLSHLYDLATSRPDLTDREIGMELIRRIGVQLARPSICLYRRSLGMAR